MAKSYFTKLLKLNWWQAGLFKTSAVSLGIILGATFKDFLIGLIPLFWITLIIPGFYILYIWVKE